ncbi:hypothetical protein V5O48_019065 [Marasmius crinis-equi]|uniref:Uncharacterized protein n=1 Tax=Marasmius crinis-equi TaxID=585013 RepID=A0ABR3EJI1_9AGAR
MTSMGAALEQPQAFNDATDSLSSPFEKHFEETPESNLAGDIAGPLYTTECSVPDEVQPPDGKPGNPRKVDLYMGPFWLRGAMKYLKIEGEEEYDLFLTEYNNAEILHRRSPGTFTHRPSCLQKWGSTKNTQQFNAESTPEMTRQFASSFPGEVWGWWFNMQPQGRVIRNGNAAVTPPGKKLQSLTLTPPAKREKLWKWGLKGWVSLLVALKWWYLSIAALEAGEQESARMDWKLAVQEMRATFTVLIGKDK